MSLFAVYSQSTSRVTGIFEHRQRDFRVPVEIFLVYWHYSIKYFKNNNCFLSILNLFSINAYFSKDFQRNVQHSIQMWDITKRNSCVHFILILEILVAWRGLTVILFCMLLFFVVVNWWHMKREFWCHTRIYYCTGREAKGALVREPTVGHLYQVNKLLFLSVNVFSIEH